MSKGRPKKEFTKEHIEYGKRLALLGLTNDKIAPGLGISLATFKKWCNEYQEFKTAIREGKELADSKVAESLYKEAIKGNVSACIFWLKNRQPALWRDKPEEPEDDTSKKLADMYDKIEII